MEQPEKSIRQVAADYEIPVGSQVVLKVAKSLSEEGAFKKPGSVGVVIAGRRDNRQPYLVQFADGQTIEAEFAELSLRRQEVDRELAQVPEDLHRYVIYVCQVGSKAFGLATDESDDDLRGIYLPPARLTWSLYALPEQLESADGERDEVYWEMEKCVRLALKANPNVLETLWTPLVLRTNETADELRTIRRAFLSKHLYKTYSGYVLSQFRRIESSLKANGTYKPKHAMHLVRLLYSGISALQTGEILIDVSDRRDELLSIRRGELTFEQVKEKALALNIEFEAAFDNTELPEQPDFALVNDFVIRARRRMVDA